MSRRLDRLEGSLHPKEAVKRWLDEAHAYGSLPAYVDSIIDQPETAQPFIALPSQVEKAVWEATRGRRLGFIKEVTLEAVGDTVFLLRLVVGLSTCVAEILRVDRLRHAALVGWSRALDAEGVKSADRSDWRRGVASLHGTLIGTERARAAAEAKYLDGHDCVFPELAAEWRGLCAAAEHLAGSESSPDEETVREAEQGVQRVVLMARADGLEASGRHRAADAMAGSVLMVGGMATSGDADG